AERSDVELAVRDVPAATLDAAGISKGAIFLFAADGALALRHAVGFPDQGSDGLGDLFGQRALLERVVAGHVTLTLPSAAAEEASRAILAGAGAATAQLVPLVSEG